MFVAIRNRKLNLMALCVLVVLGSFVWNPQVSEAATSYYVATTGSDTNSGTLASPFRTIQKAASVAVAGDTVHIRAGTYRETVTPTNSGSSGNLITYQPYNGESVTISGAEPVTAGWSVHAGSIYKATTTLGSLANDKKQIFVNGEMMVEARWPNVASQDASLSAPAFRTALTGSGTQVTESAGGLNGTANYYQGARIWVEDVNHWVAQTRAITASTGTSITYDAAHGEATPGAGSRYYVFGKLNLLDAAREWNYTGGILYLQAPSGGSPTGVEYKARETLFNLAGKSYIQLKGLKLFAGTINSNSNSNNNIFDGIDVKYISHTNIPGYPWGDDTTGILIHGSNNVVKNSKISYSSGNCLMVSGSNNKIVNNEIHDCNYYGTDDAGIYISSFYSASNNLISYNSIYNTGRGAILMKYAPGTRISYNNLSEFGELMHDMGGLYVFRTDGMGTEIDHNYVHDGPNNALTTGIYLDNGSSNYLIHHNVVWNVPNAMILNTPNNFNLIYNNTYYGPGRIIGDDWYGDQIVNNIVGAAAPSNEAKWANNLHPGDPNLDFVNPAGGNFRIGSNSAAIDAGQVITGITTGYSGSAPDIGAYEYGGTDWTPGHNFTAPPNPTYSLSAPAYRNLVANSDFEPGLSSWTKTGAQAAIIDATNGNFHSGFKAVRLGSGSSADGVSQVISLSPNTTYTLSGVGKADSGVSARLGVTGYGGSDTFVTFNTTTLTRKSLNFTTGSSNPTNVTIYYARQAGGSGFAYGDSIGLTVVQPATAPFYVQPAAFGAELVTNPGFESDFSGWLNDWGNSAITTGNVHSGAKALQIGSSFGGRQQPISSGIAGGDVYRLGGWGKVANPANHLFIGVSFSGGTAIDYNMVFHSTSYEYKEILIQAPPGSNAATVYAFGGGALLYADDISLKKATFAGGSGSTTVYEAENGTYAGGGQQQNAGNASGGKVVGNLNAVGAYSQINNVNGGAGGSATLVVRFSNGYVDTRSLSLYVNGTKVQQNSFAPTGGWNTFADTASISVTLNSGTGNTIKLQRDSGDNPAADIDKYTVTTSGGVSSGLLTGTTFGTAGTWSPPGDTYDKVYDGNTATFFDSTTATGAYAGIDLGAGNAKKVTSIKFFPRANQLARMVGGKFQGSNTSSSSGFTDLYTITSAPPAGWTEVTITDNTSYRYLRYIGGTNSYGNVNEVEFWGQ